MSKTSRKNIWKRRLESKLGLWQSKQGTINATAFKKPGSGK